MSKPHNFPYVVLATSIPNAYQKVLLFTRDDPKRRHYELDHLFFFTCYIFIYAMIEMDMTYISIIYLYRLRMKTNPSNNQRGTRKNQLYFIIKNNPNIQEFQGIRYGGRKYSESTQVQNQLADQMLSQRWACPKFEERGPQRPLANTNIIRINK